MIFSGHFLVKTFRLKWYRDPYLMNAEHVECEHVEENNSKFHNGMLLLAHAYHIGNIYISNLFLKHAVEVQFFAPINTY